jgi:hypothetical protein
MFLLPALLAGRPAGGLNSTFLQWWASHREWEESRWVELFGYLRRLRVDELVVQWTRYDDEDYRPLLERTLALAADGGMRVWVGLAQESTWWRDVGGGPAAAVETLRRVGRMCGELGRELEGLCRTQRSFRGWYLPFELEDVNWTGEAAPALVEELERLRGELGKMAVSGFTNRVMGPAGLAQWWKRVARAGLEQVFFQDGVGAGKMPLELWPAYLKALDQALGKKLRVVVELFEVVEGEGLRAAPMERIARQVEVGRRLSRGKLGSFSMVEYMTPLGGVAAGRNYELFKNFDSTHPTPRR